MGLFTQKSRYWQQKLDSFTQKQPPTLAEAFQLFDRMAALALLAHDITDKGCESRTHMMCVELMKCGYLPRKAWVFAKDGRRLSFRAPGTDTDSWWAYHAAPVLLVNAGPAQGGVIPMVFDPGIFDGPVTTAAWEAALGADAKATQVLPLGVSPSGRRGDYLPQTGTETPDSLAFTNALTDDHARRRMESLRREYGEPAHRIVLSCGLREPQHKPQWRTDGAVAAAQPPKSHSLRL